MSLTRVAVVGNRWQLLQHTNEILLSTQKIRRNEYQTPGKMLTLLENHLESLISCNFMPKINVSNCWCNFLCSELKLILDAIHRINPSSFQPFSFVGFLRFLTVYMVEDKIRCWRSLGNKRGSAVFKFPLSKAAKLCYMCVCVLNSQCLKGDTRWKMTLVGR